MLSRPSRQIEQRCGTLLSLFLILARLGHAESLAQLARVTGYSGLSESLTIFSTPQRSRSHSSLCLFLSGTYNPNASGPLACLHEAMGCGAVSGAPHSAVLITDDPRCNSDVRRCATLNPRARMSRSV